MSQARLVTPEGTIEVSDGKVTVLLDEMYQETKSFDIFNVPKEQEIEEGSISKLIPDTLGSYEDVGGCERMVFTGDILRAVEVYGHVISSFVSNMGEVQQNLLLIFKEVEASSSKKPMFLRFENIEGEILMGFAERGMKEDWGVYNRLFVSEEFVQIFLNAVQMALSGKKVSKPNSYEWVVQGFTHTNRKFTVSSRALSLNTSNDDDPFTVVKSQIGLWIDICDNVTSIADLLPGSSTTGWKPEESEKGELVDIEILSDDCILVTVYDGMKLCYRMIADLEFFHQLQALACFYWPQTVMSSSFIFIDEDDLEDEG